MKFTVAGDFINFKSDLGPEVLRQEDVFLALITFLKTYYSALKWMQ
jgi:hypothetical protein